MTTTVTITGTGVPHVAPGCAGPGVLVTSGEVRLQFDAGRATTLRLAEIDVAAADIDALFVTHHHSDHLAGLTDLLFTRWLERHGRFTPLPVVAPHGPSTDFLEKMMIPWEADIEVRMSHVGRDDHPGPDIVAFDADSAAAEPLRVWSNDTGDVHVSTLMVHHEPVTPAVAYRVDTPDGAVVISGDTVVCDEVGALAVGADVVVHEAFRRDRLRPLFDRVPQLHHIAAYHADTVELGEMAQRFEIPRLVLTHLIPQPAQDPEGKDGFVADVRSGGYTGEVIVADDLTTVEIG